MVDGEHESKFNSASSSRLMGASYASRVILPMDRRWHEPSVTTIRLSLSEGIYGAGHDLFRQHTWSPM